MPEPRYIATDWYDSPLYYDLIFDQDTVTEADFVEAAWAKHHAAERKVRQRQQLRILEPACGSGRLMRALATRGHQVAGFDLNEKMLSAARERLNSANCHGTLKRASLETFSLAGRFDIAHCLVSSFKYILTEEHAVSHLQCIADHLRPGSIYLLGIHLTDYSRKHCEHERWTDQRQVSTLSATRAHGRRIVEPALKNYAIDSAAAMTTAILRNAAWKQSGTAAPTLPIKSSAPSRKFPCSALSPFTTFTTISTARCRPSGANCAMMLCLCCGKSRSDMEPQTIRVVNRRRQETESCRTAHMR
jgi:SAM-dependent methyltransferase